MDYQLVNQRDAICKSESGLCLVLKRQVVKQLYDLSSKSRSFQGINQLWNHACVCHFYPHLLVEGKIKQRPQRYLQQQRIIARNKPIQFLDNSLLSHLIFIFSKN